MMTTDTLLEMLKKLSREAPTRPTPSIKEDLASVLSSFLKLQEGQVSQTYSATA